MASCNNRHNCLISCAEIVIGTGLKYAQALRFVSVFGLFAVSALVLDYCCFFYYTVYYTFSTSPVVLGTSPSVMPGSFWF